MMLTKVNMETLPPRMRDLPVDKRGYPVPWFVKWIDTEPEFRAADTQKFVAAIKHKLCWVCGGKLGANLCFILGPMCAITRTTAEPPCHYDCAKWSAENCPFLSNPRMIRREDEKFNSETFRDSVAGQGITRNPGAMALWICRGYEVFDDGKGGALLTVGAPDRVEWFAEGRAATRAEVEASIDSGLPILEGVAQTQPGAFEALNRKIKRVEEWLPVA